MAWEEEWLAEGQQKPGVLKCTAKDGGGKIFNVFWRQPIVTETLTKTFTDLLNAMKSRATAVPPVMLEEDKIYIIFPL